MKKTILMTFRFLKAVMVLGCILEVFRLFLENFIFLKNFFISPWPFSARILKFLGPKWFKMAQFGVWKTLKKTNFEEIMIFEGCGGSRMTKMHSGGV